MMNSLGDDFIQIFIRNLVRKCYLQPFEFLHQVFWVEFGTFTSSPISPSHSVRNIPKHEVLKFFLLFFLSSQNNSKTSIDNFTPSSSTSIMQSNPSGSSDGITDEILSAHISAVHWAIMNWRCFSVRTVSSWYVVMVSGQNDWALEMTLLDSFRKLDKHKASSNSISI